MTGQQSSETPAKTRVLVEAVRQGSSWLNKGRRMTHATTPSKKSNHDYISAGIRLGRTPADVRESSMTWNSPLTGALVDQVRVGPVNPRFVARCA